MATATSLRARGRRSWAVTLAILCVALDSRAHGRGPASHVTLGKGAAGLYAGSRRLSQVAAADGAGACTALDGFSTPVPQWMVYADPDFVNSSNNWGRQFYGKNIGSCGGSQLSGLDHQPVGMLPYRVAGHAAAFAWVFMSEIDQEVTFVECHDDAVPVTLLTVREGCGLDGTVVMPTVESSGCGYQPATFTARAGQQYSIFSQAPAAANPSARVCYRPVLFIFTSANITADALPMPSPSAAPGSCPATNLAPILQYTIQPVSPEMPMKGTKAGVCSSSASKNNPLHQPTCGTVANNSVAFGWVLEATFPQLINLTICHGPDVPPGSTSALTIRRGCDPTSPVVACFGFLSGCSYQYGGADFWAEAGSTYTIWMQLEAPQLGSGGRPVCAYPQLFVTSYGPAPPAPPPAPGAPSPFPESTGNGTAVNLSPPIVQGAPSSTSPPAETGGGSKTGMIVGVTIGVCGAVLAIAAVAAVFWRRRAAAAAGRQRASHTAAGKRGSSNLPNSLPPGSEKAHGSYGASDDLSGDSSAVVMLTDDDVGLGPGSSSSGRNSNIQATGADGSSGSISDSSSTLGLKSKCVFGLMPGDVFLKATADNYRWTDYLPDTNTCFVEAGVNDGQLDQWASITPGGAAARLTKEELQSQVELLSDGLLGKGASAYVFACRWKKRFGGNALLAAKVLMDGYNAEPYLLDAFAYEAGVLANVRHPNIVRLYGYCLEPPCMCLILELLPGSLQSVLYASPTAFQTLQASRQQLLPGKQREGQPNNQQAGADVTQPVVGAGQGVPGSSMLAGTGLSSPGSALSAAVSGWGTQARHLAAGSDGTAFTNDVTVSIDRHSALSLTMLEVLRICRDVAAGLAHLHDQPVVLAPCNATPGRPRQGLAVIQEQPAVMTRVVDGLGDQAVESTKVTARVVHRDLKPANILVGATGTAKISDFGLARQTYTTTLHTASVGAGTLPYMAPELLLGRSDKAAAADKATSRVDIYSMAMIMWEVVARQQPWRGRSEVEILAAVTMGLRPDLPGDVSGCLAGGSCEAGTQGASLELDKLGCSPVDQGKVADPSQLPASFSALPGFTHIMTQCWQQQPLQRPTASQVHEWLQQLYSAHMGHSSLPVPPG